MFKYNYNYSSTCLMETTKAQESYNKQEKTLPRTGCGFLKKRSADFGFEGARDFMVPFE